MIRYSIGDLVLRKRRRPGRVKLPGLFPRSGTERDYKIALNRMLRAIAAAVRDQIIPAYAAERRVTKDVDTETLRQLAAALSRTASDMVGNILALESARHTDDFMAQAKRVLGIDISAVVNQEDLGEYLRLANARNTGLIKSLSDDVVKQVEQIVIKNQLAGNSVATLKAELMDRFNVADSRAQLIARDQVGKLTSDLTRIRQEQAGIDEYGWLTSRDERVRPRHQDCNGKVYKWGQPTDAEDGLPPGQPIQCRCVAQGIITFGEQPLRLSRRRPPLRSLRQARRTSIRTRTVSIRK